MLRKLAITIDGPAGAGKSTIAKRVADKLSYTLIDTGAMYRSVTCAALLYEVDINNSDELAKLASKLEPSFKNTNIHYYINKLYLTPFIRGLAVSGSVSEVSTHKEVRNALVDLQRKITNSSPNGSVMEGRDAGSTVLPNADIKIYLTASVETRAQRRLNQLQKQGLTVSIAEIKKDIEKRDKIDSEREISPLTIPDNALIIDSSHKSIEDVVEIILNSVQEEMEK